MPKREGNNFKWNLPKKKSRFDVLAEFDDGDRKDQTETDLSADGTF
jgi:hypothetical protein